MSNIQGDVMNKLSKWSTAVGTMLFVAAAAQAAPTVANGGFETGDFSGWSLAGEQGFSLVDTGYQRSGDFSAFFGEVGTPAVLSQSLATDIGHTYSVSFWLANLGGSINNAETVNSFGMLLDGARVVDVQSKDATGYTQYAWTFTAASASTSLAFSFQHDETFWLLDDVAISDISTIPAVPEPSAALLLMLGLGVFALRRRQR
jgi:hypothetical protein